VGSVRKVRIGVLEARRGLVSVRGYHLHPASEVVAPCDMDQPGLEKEAATLKIEGLKLKLWRGLV
jgi:hypothetical protein